MSKVQITAFTGEYHFLSNYCACPVTIDGLTYRSAEAAFQAAKCNVPIDRAAFCTVPPNVAKAIGRKIKLRKGWEKERDSIMADVIHTATTLQGDTVAGALLARDYKGPGRADSLGRVIAQPVGADLYNGTLTGDRAVTLTTATGQGGANTGPSVIEKIIRWIVRRLTPTECERLQGYPDGWTDLGSWIDSKGKTHKDADTPRYKALGNSIALPQWYYVLGGISDRLPEDATLGSLFDGIGGFPYVWAQLHTGRKELCVWASEIEEFPIAVTKKWFPEVEDGKLF